MTKHGRHSAMCVDWTESFRRLDCFLDTAAWWTYPPNSWSCCRSLQMMTALPGPPATGQMINTYYVNNKHYPTRKYLKHCCQPCNLCLVGDDPIQVKRTSGNSFSRLTSSTRVTTEAASHNVQRYWLYCFEASVFVPAWVVLQLRMLASCYAADSLRRRLSVLLLYFMSVCHSFLVCMRDGSPNISYFHRWKSNGMMRWWNDNDETVSSPTKVFGVSDHDGDRPV